MLQLIKEHFDSRITWGLWVLKASAFIVLLNVPFFVVALFLPEKLAIWFFASGLILSTICGVYLTKLRLKKEGY